MFDFFLQILSHPMLVLMARIFFIVSFLLALCAGYLVLTGVLPVLYRLGKSLSARQIAVFAKGDNYVNLKSVLIDSELFKKKNVHQIDENSIEKAKSMSVFLVYWKDYATDLENILGMKEDNTALIIYAPPEDGRIEPENMQKISEHRSAAVVNFRGRLIQDVMVCMMTSRSK